MNIAKIKLFSEDAIKVVKFICSDSDSREISAIGEVIEKYFTLAMRGRCS